MPSHQPEFAHHFTDTVFRSESVALDGNRFERCQFFDCQLRFSGQALPVLVECDVREGCEFILAGAARTTFQFLSLLLYRSGEGGRETVDRLTQQLYAGAFE